MRLQEAHALLSSKLEKEGFSICAPFPLKEYNKLAKKHQIYSASEDAVGFVIGSGQSFWDPFIEWLPTPFPKDPVDSFTRNVVERVIEENFVHLNFEIRYDYHYPPNPKFVHVQTAAHVAAAAYYDQDVLWCIHAEFGVWCVFRAVVIFHDVLWEGPLPTPPQPLLSQEEKNQLLELTDVANEEGWGNHTTLLSIRDTVAHGQEHRYTGFQLDYFYPIVYTKRQVLFNAKYEREANPDVWKDWGETKSFMGRRASHCSVCVGDNIYVVGGYGYDEAGDGPKYLSDIQFAAIAPDGSLSEWRTTKGFHGSRAGHSCVAHGGIIYLIGGWGDGGYYSDVQRAIVGEDGTIDEWQAIGNIPRAQSHHASFVFKAHLKTYLYVVAGICQVNEESIRLDDAFFCTVLPDGALGDWRTCHHHMKGGRSSPACYVWDNTLFVAGGWGDNVDDIYSDVQYSALRQDGQLSPWRTSPHSLKIGVYGHAILVSHGKVICVGGNGGQGNIFDTVTVSCLDEMVPHEWFWNKFPAPRALWGHQIVRHANYVYLVGGYERQGPVSSVYYVADRAPRDSATVTIAC